MESPAAMLNQQITRSGLKAARSQWPEGASRNTVDTPRAGAGACPYRKTSALPHGQAELDRGTRTHSSARKPRAVRNPVARAPGFCRACPDRKTSALPHGQAEFDRDTRRYIIQREVAENNGILS